MVYSDLLMQYYLATHVPLSFFKGKELEEKIAPDLQDFNLPLFLLNGLPEQLPHMWYSLTPEHLYFGGMWVEEAQGVLFVGPVILDTCRPRQLESILHCLGRTAKDAAAMKSYFEHNISCDAMTLHAHIRLLYQILNKQQPSAEMVKLPFAWKLPYLLPESLPLEARDSIEVQDAFRENALMSCLRFGRLEELDKLLVEEFSGTQEMQELTLEHMRSYILSANLMASRTAMSVGVDYDLATALGSHYLDQMLVAKTKQELARLFVECMREYTKRTADVQKLSSPSHAVRRINQYVQAHLYERTTPSVIADHMHMNCSYLCTHFKKETGKTIVHYVQECKVQEAMRLLQYSDLSLVTIGEMLCFSSQSYFCSVFKKVTGRTPQEYRERIS